MSEIVRQNVFNKVHQRRHRQTILGGPMVPCPDCGYEMESKGLVKVAIELGNDIREKTLRLYECPNCLRVIFKAVVE